MFVLKIADLLFRTMARPIMSFQQLGFSNDWAQHIGVELLP